MRTREQGPWPKIMKRAGSMKLVIWEQGAQKKSKGSEEQMKIIK